MAPEKKKPHTLAGAKRALQAFAKPAKAVTLRRFFKDTSDIFIGVTTAEVRTVARTFQDLPLTAVARLMRSKIHEERSLAHAILVFKFRAGDEAGQKEVFTFFLKHRGTIREWDGVDDSAPYIVGPYLAARSKTPLYRLVKSRNMWDRRIAIVATLPLIRSGDIGDALKLVAHVLGDAEDLLHKAAGWILREVGKRNAAALRRFLRKNYADMPRTALRYAIERFPAAERARILKGDFG